jgi:hypothetical protein
MQRPRLLLTTVPALGGALLWGLVEWMALWRSRHAGLRRRSVRP